MQRYKIKIEYEGTQFVGWQFQKNGQSVQEVLQKAIYNFHVICFLLISMLKPLKAFSIKQLFKIIKRL